MFLTPPQQRHLYASLLSFEKALRFIDRLLSEGDEEGILYTRKLNLTLQQRQKAREKISQALQELAQFANEVGLVSKEEDINRIIIAEMSISWTNLEDCRSKQLKGYGELHPEVAVLIDPTIVRLAKAALGITQTITADARKNDDSQG